jgi:hypothetical protein
LTGAYLKVANESIAENFCGGCERDHFCVIDLLHSSLLRFGSFYENGKVVEGWNNSDTPGMLQQLGEVPAPGQAS